MDGVDGRRFPAVTCGDAGATPASPVPASGPQQLGLLDVGPVAWDGSFATARRIPLDERSWVEHVPGWLTGSRELFDLLAGEAGWEQRRRWMFDEHVIEPRLTAEYPVLADAPAPLPAIAAALSARYRSTYDGLWINLYRDHRDSTSWHADRPADGLAEAVVPVLSLGATRRFLIRPAAGGRSVRVTPAAGDLVVMGGRAQRDWRHMVPKQAGAAGARISVNFRLAGPGAGERRSPGRAPAGRRR